MEFWRKSCRAAVAGSRKVRYLGWRDLSPGLERTLSSEVLLLNLVSGGPAPCYCLCVEAGGVGHARGLCVCCCTTHGYGWGRFKPHPVRCLTACVGEESGVPSLGPLLLGSLGHGAGVAWRLEWGVLCLQALPACWKNLLPGEVPVLCCHLDVTWRPLSVPRGP